MTVELRPYQDAGIDSLRLKIHAGKKRIVFVLPTGGGKTVCLAAISSSFLSRGSGRVLIIVHRKELVTQTLDKLAAVGVKAGVVMGSDPRAAPWLPVQVASIQTLSRRLEHLPEAQLVIYDECHHAPAAGAREVLSRYTSAILIGFTATPFRSDKVGLGDVFEDLVVAATPQQLLQLGALVPADCFAYDAPDLHEVPVTAGDYNQRDLGIACNTNILVGSIVREYLAHAHGRRAIVFPVDVEHSQHLVKEFQAAGVLAEHLDWSTPAPDRSRILRGLGTGAVTVVSSVGVLTEGFDCPAAEVAILARPTKSLALFMQMIGRVLRPSAPTGKSRALVHDHGGNLFRHGFPDDPREYALKPTPQRIRDLMCCTDCGFMVGRWPADGLCPKCGSLQHLPAEQRAEAEKRRGKEIVEGKRLSRAEIEELRARFAASGRQLSRAQAEKVGNATKAEQASEYLRLLEVQRRKGLKDGFVWHAFLETFGRAPRFKPEDLVGVAPAASPFLPLPPRRDHREAA